MRVLIVDDNAPVRALARVYAEQEGAVEVVEAADGAEAVRAALDADFGLVVIDYHMPVLDGLEATRAILARRPGTAIVAWTSIIDSGIEQAFVEAGALCHVPKTDTDALRRIIRERSAGSTAQPGSVASSAAA